MAASEILAVGTTDASSSEVAVSAGSPVTVCLKDASGPVVAASARAEIWLKDDDGEFFVVDKLNQTKQAAVLVGPGTYVVRRYNTGASFGVFKDG